MAVGPPWFPWVVGFAPVACAVHAAAHRGRRWQALPAYLVTAAAVLLPQTTVTSWPFAAVGVTCLAASGIASFLLPYPRLPEPTGPYAPARAVVRVPVRNVSASEPAGLGRIKRSPNTQPSPSHFFASVYFPVSSTVAAAAKQPWPLSALWGPSPAPLLRLRDKVTRGLARFLSLPNFVFSHLAGVHSPFVDVSGDRGRPTIKCREVDGEIVDQYRGRAPAPPLPVIMFSHGLGACPDMYSALVADFVSHGYVVIAPEHTDGSAAYAELIHGQDKVHAVDYEPLTEAEGSDEAAQQARRTAQLRHRVAEVDDALTFILDAANGTAGSLPRGIPQLDPARVVCMGHSFGGATAFAAAGTDARVKAAVCLDMWGLPLNATEFLDSQLPRVPVLVLQGATFYKWSDNHAEVMQALEQSGHAASTLLGIAGTGHQSFTDFAFHAPTVLRRGKMIGDMSENQAHTYITTYARRWIGQCCSNAGAHTPLDWLHNHESPPNDIWTA